MEENKLPELDKSILPWLGRTMKALDYYLNDHFASKGLKLTKVQMILLKVLSQRGPMAQNNLAFITNRDKTSLTRLISTMEKKNFVARTVDENDKRIKVVQVTNEGKKMFESAIPILQEIMERIQTGIDKKDLDITIKVLKQIGNNINVDELTTPLNN